MNVLLSCRLSLFHSIFFSKFLLKSVHVLILRRVPVTLIAEHDGSSAPSFSFLVNDLSAEATQRRGITSQWCPYKFKFIMS